MFRRRVRAEGWVEVAAVAVERVAGRSMLELVVVEQMRQEAEVSSRGSPTQAAKVTSLADSAPPDRELEVATATRCL